MATMSSRCREAVESSQCLARKGMQCVLLSVPSRPRQLKTQITGAGGSPRRSLRRRRLHLAQALARQVPSEALRQHPHPFKGLHTLSHRKARPALSSGLAHGLCLGEPLTFSRSRGRRSGTIWRHVSKHVSLRKEQGKEGQALGSSSREAFRSCRSQES